MCLYVRVAVAVVALVVQASLVAAQEKVAPSPSERPSISADELGRSIVVKGPLGPPLGEVVTVEGTVVRGSRKGVSHLFAVNTVNGEPLAKPVSMEFSVWPWSDIKELEPDKRYLLRAYQNGTFKGVPEQAMRETTFVQTQSYGFSTSLVVVRSAKRR